MEYQDKYIKCFGCGEEFLFESGEQRFFAEKLLKTPKHCKKCLAKRRASIDRRPEEVWRNDYSNA